MISNKNKFLVLILIVGLMLALVACGGGETPPAEPADQSQGESDTEGTGTEPSAEEGRVYLVGTEPTFPPFEYADEDTGEIIGFDVDLIKAIGQEAGIQVEIESMGFDGLISALQTQMIDIVIAGMTVTPERAEAVDFGPTYFDAYLRIAVAEGNEEIQSADDLQGKTVGVQIGTTGALKAEELKQAGIVKDVLTYNTVDVVFTDLIQGGVDAVINDSPVTEVYMSRNPGKVKMVGEPFEGESYAYAVAKGNEELLEKLNDGLEKVKEKGIFDELVMEYFGG